MTETKTEKNKARPSLSQPFLKRFTLSLPDSKTQLMFWSFTVGGLALDLWTKKAVFNWLKPREIYPVIDGFLQLVKAENDGAAFGMFAGKSYFLTATSIIALILIFGFFLFSGSRQKLFNIALGLFTAGVCGNLYDRLFNNGSVRDFIDVYYRSFDWPAFNVADSLLCIGVGLLIISSFLTEKPARKHDQQQK